MKKERLEALIRIPIAIISGIILELWGILTTILVIINFFFVIFTGKRNKDLVNFTNLYVNYMYKVLRYVTFNTNERPFPFKDMGKPMEKPDYKFQN